MKTLTIPRLPRFLAVALALGLSLGVTLPFFSAPPPAAADTAPVDPTNPGTPITVSADALPTTQIDRVAWAQVIVGNTVYVAGNFTTARPAGAAPGVNTVPRNNLLAYNIETGNLISSFAPSLNAQALAITASPDGSRIYVGGDFTAVNGVPYYRIVAISTATGQVISSFRPIMGSQVRALAATNTTVYAGGTFQSVNGQQRRFLAQMNASDGSLTNWVADADDVVYSMTLTVDGSKLIAGGRFQHIESADRYGLAALDSTTGDTLPWAVGNQVRDASTDAAIVSLHATADRVYGSGYVFGSTGNLEGIFSADPDTGNVVWIEDCHGDTVSTWPLGDAVYAVGHMHYCGNIGGFPQTDPWTMHHSISFSKAATGVITPDPYGYYNWAGNPSPSLLDWFPNWIVGSYTGQGQASWSITGNDRYITTAGEFPYVNGVAQYGLTRFAITSIAPNKVGPVVNTELVPTTASFTSGEVRISWTATYDRDNTHLSYSLVRDGNTAAPVYQTTQDSTFWLRPTMGFIDRGLAPGSTHTYRLYVTDPWNNSISRLGSPVTVSSTNSGGPYGDSVAADNPAAYWPLDESSGSVGFDHVGFTDLPLQAGVSRGASGPVSGATASTFSGNNTGFGATQSAIDGPNTFTVESWIRTATNQGGKIIGFGASNTGDSASYDRHVYMDNSGRIWFGVYPGGVQTVNSSASYNNGQWHQIVASLGSNGMRLYVDGVLVGSRTDVTTAQAYSGYWKVGGDNLNGWPSQPASNYFQGDIAQVAVYPTVLSRSDAIDHWVASGRTSPLPPAPADAYGAAVYNLNPDMYWRLGDSTGNTMLDSGQNQFNGNYSGSVTKGVAGAITGSNTAVTFSGGTASSQAQFTNPTTYSLETWFKTTTTVGGKLVGFGNERSNLSSNYDRHIYMQDDGTLVFGVWTGQTNTITSPNSYNNGQWHYVVATQSSDGMTMYVDGALVGTNPQTEAQGYTGYWRIGGDNTWSSSSPYFAGTLDEVAVYPTALTAQTVANHYALGTTGTPPNQTPIAAFDSVVTNLSVAFDASASTDPDGSISSYAWDFGDGQTGTGVTTSHTYADAGPHTVMLTVTDNQLATGTMSHVVTTTLPPVNLLPSAAFTSTLTGMTAALNAGGSVDPDGTIADYAWDFGDGQVGSGVSVSHSYASPGNYTVILTVTDNDGGTGTASHGLAPTSTSVVPAPDHVVVVVMENKSDSQVIGNADAPYINSLASGGALMTQSFGVMHPSQPNYLALFSGSTNGVTTDDCPNTFTTTNLANQLTATGKSFTGYAESMPSAGYTGCFSGDYQRKHNPWVNWPSVPAASNQPFTSFPTDYSTLPTVSFVVPNLQHDMHDGTIAQADTWLQGALGAYATWAKTHNSLLVLTWDEDDGGVSNHIPTIFVGERVNTGAYSQVIDHYDVLRTLQDAYALPSNDSSAAATPIGNIWSVVAPNQPPVAAFTSSTSGLTASFNAAGSTDADGSIVSYAWNFGDGQTGSGVTTSHAYANPGTYSATLTVTDDDTATNAVSHPVTVTSPAGSVIAQDAFTRALTGGWGSADTGGAWTLTGAASNFSVSGGAGRVTVGAGSTRTATLGAVSSTDADIQATVAFDSVPTGGGAYANLIGRQVGSSFYIANVWVKSTGVISLVLKQGATVLGVVGVTGVSYTAGMPLQLRFQVTGTSPTTVRAKVWPSGQPEPSAWLASFTDSTSALQAAGSIALQAYLSGSATSGITASFDNLLATTSAVAPPNQAPVAAFTTSTANLTVSVNAGGSSDPDGTISSYAWNFGDGQTGSGVTASHSYATAGTYPVALTVTDNQTATNSVAHSVTVTAPPVGVIAQDDFTTAIANGWGVADVGGTWTVAGSASAYQVSGGVGQLIIPAGSTKTSMLAGASSTAANLRVSFSPDQSATGGGIYVSAIGRDVGATNYQARVWMQSTGAMRLQLLQGSTILQSVIPAGLSYTAGATYQLRLEVSGTGPTTIRAKVWADGSAEPAAWQASTTDATPALQVAGSIGLRGYLSASATAVPVAVRFDDLLVSPPQ